MTFNLASVLAEGASRHPGKTALIVDDQRLDYATVDMFARMFAGALHGLGVEPGSPVAVVLPNVPHFTVAFFGALYAGNPVVPLNVLLTPDEFAFHLRDSEAALVVVWELFVEGVREAAASAPNLHHVVVAKADLADLDAPEGCLNLTALMSTAAPVDQAHPTESDDTAMVLYTSGTTGRPKGAELTHGNLASNARVIGEVVSLSPDTIALAALPLFHAFGLTVMHNATLTVGGTVVLLARFQPKTAMDLMIRHRVTFFGGVAAMYAALLQVPGVAEDDLAALEWCVSGAAPLPAEVLGTFERRFGVTLLEGYGLSETSPVVSFTMPGRPRTPGSIGYPVPGVEVRLLGDDGEAPEGPGVPGELCVRGENVMKGYWRNPDATSAAIVHGWFHTGDVAERDENGAYRLIDRKKELINRAGYKVYPREVEDVLYRHPGVAQAAVIGVPDDRVGEEVKAFVALKAGQQAAPAELIEFCREHLAAYKYPRTVEIREELPVGPTGKILKRALKG